MTEAVPSPLGPRSAGSTPWAWQHRRPPGILIDMSAAMRRLNEALEGRYSIERELGAGGMATVYLAHDARHDRSVAIKVLRPDLAAVIGAERFLAEIRTTARLQHPHVLPLHDSGAADGLLFYVMPYVEGETLRDRLDRECPLPLDEALAITRELADGLGHAHGLGIVHRDIKPANVLLSGGHAIIVDFGIATAVDSAGGERLTETGLTLGTPAYMSPEQAGGRGADVRSDIYALGCVVYEMISGDPPFVGSSARAILARKTVEEPPPLRTIRPTIPRRMERAILKALATVPADRFASTADFVDALVSSRGGARAGSIASRWSRRVVSYGLPAVAAVLLLVWGISGRSADGPNADLTATIRPLTNFVGWEHSPTWSPDGTMIAYTHIVGGDADIATLSAAGGDPHILTADSPADEFLARWSPDGALIAFTSDRGDGTDVYVIPPTGGAEQKLVETGIPFFERLGAWAGVLGTNAWSPDSRQLAFSKLDTSGAVALWKIDLATRQETRLTSPASAVEDGWASWSGDGRTIVFVRGDRGSPTLWQISSEGGEAEQLLDEPVSHPAWFPDARHLVFASPRSGAFNLWRLDTRTGQLTQLTQGAGRDWTPAVATNGTVAYQQFGHEIELRWGAIETPEDEHARLTSFTGGNFGGRVSPDGSRVLYYSDRSGNHDIWVLDRTTGQHRPITSHPAADRLADWSPDGEEIVFMSNRGGEVRLWIADAETGATRAVSDHALPWEAHEAEAQGGPRWSPDGRWIGYLAPADGESAIWIVSPDGKDRRPTAVRGARSFGWYMDGERLLYTRHAGEGSRLVELRATHLGTGTDLLIRAGQLAETAISPDGSAVSFVQSPSHFTMDLYVMPLTPPDAGDGLPRGAGAPRRITFGGGKWHVHNGGWAPDGSAVVYSRDRDYGDIFVIEPPDED